MKKTVNDCSLIELTKIENRAGNITSVTNQINIPFQIKRIFYIYDIPGGKDRGAHAHKECHQFIIATSGSFEIEMDDGINKRTVTLNRPYYGLHIPPGIWAAEKSFSSGAVCLVLASHKYDEFDYIRDFKEYKKYQMIHSTSEVQSSNIGKNTNIWQYCVVLEKAIIGENCNINYNVFIENYVLIGNNVTVKSGVQLWDGIILEDNVFIGPNVTFSNDKYPRSKQYPEKFQKTIIKKGASIGAGSVILCGIQIGENAMIGAGSVVTKDVPPNELWMGHPAKFIRYINTI